MTLKQLFSIFGKIDWRSTSPDTPIVGVHADSRKITGGMVFVATRGVGRDGHDYLPQAIDQGAVAVVVETVDNIPEDFSGVILQVLDAKWALSQLLSLFYSKPEERLISIGVTGTNGKTSTAYLLEAFLSEAQIPCGVMGTIDHHFQDKIWKSQLTTPDTNTFYERLEQFSSAGAKAFVMEISSHSLKQRRIPILFDVAIFTNFTRDHLDYHQTMQDYFDSKQMLFTDHLKTDGDTFAILNGDDEAVAAVKVAPQTQKIFIGQKNQPRFGFKKESESLEGTIFSITEAGVGSFKYTTGLVGTHNLYNITGAVAAARVLGISHSHCQRALQKFTGIPGRLQRVPNIRQRHAFVDYAHTPDALEKVLEALREMRPAGSTAKIITIFGCGGDRDKGKRPLMGRTAQKFSDQIVVTSDNPRSEDPQAILQDIVQGLDPAGVIVEADREKAFRAAVQASRPGDILLIAGKGHEDYQIIGSQTLHFSDFDTMKTILQELKA